MLEMQILLISSPLNGKSWISTQRKGLGFQRFRVENLNISGIGLHEVRSV